VGNNNNQPTGWSKDTLAKISKYGGIIQGSSGIAVSVKNLAELMQKRVEQLDRSNR